MPRKVARRTLKGRGRILDWLKRANTHLRKTKMLSKLGSRYGKSGLPYAGSVGTAAGIAQSLGYGRRRAIKGRGLRLAGGMRRCR
jgi:hypothetical protein